jgi:hypothetical protein
LLEASEPEHSPKLLLLQVCAPPPPPRGRYRVGVTGSVLTGSVRFCASILRSPEEREAGDEEYYVHA